MWSLQDILAESKESGSSTSEGRVLTYDLKFKSEKHSVSILKIYQISTKFNRPIQLIISFLKHELSSSVRHDVRNDLLTLSTKTSSLRLRELFADFIKKYISCENCKLNDTVLESNKLTCSGCGHTSEVILYSKS